MAICPRLIQWVRRGALAKTWTLCLILNPEIRKMEDKIRKDAKGATIAKELLEELRSVEQKLHNALGK